MKTSLEEQLNALKDLDKAILGLLEEENIEESALGKEIEESCRYRAELTANISMISAKLAKTESATPAPSPAPEEQVSGQASALTQKSTRAKLQKHEVPKFRGRVDEWQEFCDSFESAININESLSDMEQFSYLRGLLEGSAKSIIEGFALSAANYEVAVTLLKKRFGKRNLIQSAHIEELMKVVPVYNKRDTPRLRSLYDGVETHYRGLTAIGVEKATYSSIVVPSILDKLPETVRLTMTRGEDYQQWDMQELLAALATEVEHDTTGSRHLATRACFTRNMLGRKTVPSVSETTPIRTAGMSRTPKHVRTLYVNMVDVLSVFVRVTRPETVKLV